MKKIPWNVVVIAALVYVAMARAESSVGFVAKLTGSSSED